MLGMNGYFLQQLHNNTLNKITVPNSKERVFAVGPGMLYLLGQGVDNVLFASLYFETDVRNRPQGINGVLRLLVHF